MADIDYKKAVEDKKSNPVYARMDEDRKLVELSQYTLTDASDQHKDVPNAISITLNDPAVFAANVEASLGNATEQVVVESEDKNLDTAYIEDFVRATLLSASQRLTKQGRFPLTPFFDQQVCRRGRAAARCLFRINKDGVLIPDIVPWDTRYMYYGMDDEGMAWAAYETTRDKEAINSRYKEANVTEEESTVLDIWSRTHNEVWVGENKKVEDRKHDKGCVPVCFQMVPMGSMTADKDSLVHQGESIFFLIRDLIPELNRLVSIIQSLNQKALDNAMLWKTAEGTGGTPPKYRDLTSPGAVTSADIGGGVETVNYGEIKRSAYLLHSMIETRIQRGSVSNLDLGIMGNQPWSAVSLIEIGEGRDQVFLPRLGTRGLLNEQLADMQLEQVINSGATFVEIGTRGHKRTFDVRKLQGEYEVKFKYFIKSPKIDIARFSMAAAAGNLIPDKAKRRDILQREDPEEDERQLRWEEAERLSPAIKMNRTIKGLLEMAKRGDKDAEFEAELMSAEMGMNLKQLLAGEVGQQPKPEEAEKPKPMVPMFGGPSGSARKAAELEATPRAEGGGE